MDATPPREGDIVSARNWPDTKGRRYRVTGVDPSDVWGFVYRLQEVVGATAVAKIRYIPLQHCVVETRNPDVTMDSTGREEVQQT